MPLDTPMKAMAAISPAVNEGHAAKKPSVAATPPSAKTATNIAKAVTCSAELRAT